MSANFQLGKSSTVAAYWVIKFPSETDGSENCSWEAAHPQLWINTIKITSQMTSENHQGLQIYVIRRYASYV